ncbi:MAG: aldo/keto reductase [Butyrivibrio sp.]|nr:aldo/keto reductase [Butyrivibrio sp.]
MAENYFGENTPKLGFGLMRLPRVAGKENEIDIEQTSKMVDMFIEAGLTYFDTAFVYEGSEEATRKALVERYPRDAYTLATKLNAGYSGCRNAEDAKKELEISLERTGAGYFDYYLLHALGKGNIDKYDSYGIWDFVKEMKEKGLIKHWGFSFHDTPEFLDELLTKHPDAEFVQLQINYADWDNPSVQSRACYEVARKHGKSIVVMEPVKGGALANPHQAVQDVFKKANPEMSVASWAIRFVASLDGILTVLSGMSNVQQMADNLSYMADFKKLTPEEEEVIKKAQETLKNIDSIPCTACHYCTKGCPMQINIPAIFAARNKQLIFNLTAQGQGDYDRAINGRGKASDCIACGQCEAACPQHINIIERLQECASNFEH